MLKPGGRFIGQIRAQIYTATIARWHGNELDELLAKVVVEANDFSIGRYRFEQWLFVGRPENVAQRIRCVVFPQLRRVELITAQSNFVVANNNHLRCKWIGYVK